MSNVYVRPQARLAFRTGMTGTTDGGLVLLTSAAGRQVGSPSNIASGLGTLQYSYEARFVIDENVLFIDDMAGLLPTYPLAGCTRSLQYLARKLGVALDEYPRLQVVFPRDRCLQAWEPTPAGHALFV